MASQLEEALGPSANPAGAANAEALEEALVNNLSLRSEVERLTTSLRESDASSIRLAADLAVSHSKVDNLSAANDALQDEIEAREASETSSSHLASSTSPPASLQVAALQDRVLLLESQLQHEEAQHSRTVREHLSRTAAVQEKTEASLLAVRRPERETVDRAAQAEEAATQWEETAAQSDLLVKQARERLLLLETQLEVDRGVLQRTTDSRDQWKRNSERLTRERSLEGQAAEDHASGLQLAEARSRLAEERLEATQSRVQELETTAAQSVLLRTQVSQFREELEAAHAENLLVSSARLALEAKNETNEEAHGRAISRHQDAMGRFQTLVSGLRAEQTSMLQRVHEAAAKASADEDLVRSASDAKEQADLRVVELEGQLSIQRNLTDKASVRCAEVTDSMKALDQERREALVITGDAVKDMEASGLLEEQRNDECARPRSLCDTKAEECARLQTLQLTDRSVADPAPPAKLQETENYLKQCTEAFHKLKSDAMTMDGEDPLPPTDRVARAGRRLRQAARSCAQRGDERYAAAHHLTARPDPRAGAPRLARSRRLPFRSSPLSPRVRS